VVVLLTVGEEPPQPAVSSETVMSRATDVGSSVGRRIGSSVR
jgi:hypothetical protein